MGIPDLRAPGLRAIADNVRKTRQQRNVSRDMMAAALGVDDRTVMAWESGEVRIAPQLLYRISLFLGVRVSALFAADDPITVEKFVVSPLPGVSEARPAAFDRLLFESRHTMQTASAARRRVSLSSAQMLAAAASLNAAIAETRASLGRFKEEARRGLRPSTPPGLAPDPNT